MLSLLAGVEANDNDGVGNQPFSLSTCKIASMCPPPWGNVSKTACLSNASGFGTP
jgi:hypothetical protein